jgi:hypothetical protein
MSQPPTLVAQLGWGFVVHPDMKSHTGGMTFLGKGVT